MKISNLQKFILKQCLNSRGGKITKAAIYQFYSNKKNKPKTKDLINIVTKSIERLINRELVIGFGRRTAHKWFIDEVKITPHGKKFSHRHFGFQQKLPLK